VKVESNFTNTHQCRLCDSSVSRRFNLTILGRHDVEYFECENCGSLQTELPYWLDEAYRNDNLASSDTGAAQRNIHNLAACFSISRLFNAKNAIDIGGGDGLLCRLLRDYEINCYVKDKYAVPTYAQGFVEENFDKPDLVIGFEVLEHFPNPSSDLGGVFGYGPDVVLLSTGIYTNQDSNWWYLSPESGQHIFFYGKKALEFIARKYGYSLLISGGFILFIKQYSPLKIAIAKILLSKVICRLIRGWIVLLPARGVWKDHALQVEKSKIKSSAHV